MKKKIVTDLKILKQKSVEAAMGEAKEIIKDLEDTLVGKKGLGLSAIQIGIAKRVSIVRIGEGKINLINPKITDKYDKFKHKSEGCLSLPGLRVDTLRYREIEVESDGLRFVEEGLAALVIQHEINHMDGKLITDAGIKWKKGR